MTYPIRSADIIGETFGHKGLATTTAHYETVGPDGHLELLSFTDENGEITIPNDDLQIGHHTYPKKVAIHH